MKIRTPFALSLFPTLLLLVRATESKPSVVIMMVDDMGFAGPSIAPYGNPHYKTPGMDRLAREGMLFTDFHSSGTVCSSTRAGLLTTGRYLTKGGHRSGYSSSSDHPEHRKGLQKSRSPSRSCSRKPVMPPAWWESGITGYAGRIRTIIRKTTALITSWAITVGASITSTRAIT